MTERSSWLREELVRYIERLETERANDERLLEIAELKRQMNLFMDEARTRAKLSFAIERIAQALGARADADPAWIAGEAIAWLRRCPDVDWVCPDCGGDREQCRCEWPVEGE